MVEEQQSQKISSDEYRFVFGQLGLPDSEILGPNGKAQEAVVRRTFELSRDQSRRFAKGMRSSANKIRPKVKLFPPRQVFMNHMSDPEIRMSISASSYEELRERAINTIENSDDAPISGKISQTAKHFSLLNWELVTLFRYAPDLWERSHSEEKLEELEMPLREAYEDIDPELKFICIDTATRLEDDVANWNSHPRIKKQHLASVLYALGCVTTMKLVQRMTERQPELLQFYTFMMGVEHNIKLSETSKAADHPGDTGTEVKNITETTAFHAESFTPAELYEKIEAAVQKAKTAPMDPSVAPDIKKLADMLVQWYEDNPQTRPLDECIDTFIFAMYGLGNNISLMNFEQEMPSESFKAVWYDYLNQAQGMAEDDLVKQLIKAQKVVDRQGELLDGVGTEISSLHTQQQELRAETHPTRAQRRESEERDSELSIQIQQRRQRRDEAEDEAIFSLLPLGSTVEDLEAPPEIDKPGENVDPATHAALQAVSVYLEEDVSDDVDDEDESVVPEAFAQDWGDAFGEKTEPSQEEVANASVDESDPDDQDEDHDEPSPEPKELEFKSESEEYTTDENPVSESDLHREEKEPDFITAEEAEEELAEPEPVTEVGEEIELDPTEPEPVAEGEEDIELELEEERVVGAREQAWIQQINDTGTIEGEVANQAIIDLIGNGRAEEAHWLSVLLDEKHFASEVIPSDLIRAAIYGRNNWDLGKNLNKTQKLILGWSNTTIEEWCALPGADRVVPYLVLNACYQATLFGGKYSNAPYLLSSVKPNFDGPLARLLDETIALANRATVVPLKELRSGGEPTVPTDYTQQIEDWKQKMVETKRGYAPVLKAQSYLTDKGPAGEIIRAIRSNSTSAIPAVAEFCTTYTDSRLCDELLDECVSAVGFENHIGKIAHRAYSRFYSKVAELISIARDWMAERGEKTSESQQFAKRFRTALPNVIAQLDATRSDSGSPADRRAGASMALQMFKGINSVIEGNSRSVWEYNRAKAWLHYPEILAKLQGRGDKALDQLSWYLREADAPVDHDRILKIAMDENEPALAYLMYLYLRDQGDDRKMTAEELDRQISAHRTALRRRCSRLESQIDNMLLSLLVDANRSDEMLLSIEELRESIDSLEHYGLSADISTLLDNLDTEIRQKVHDKLEDLTGTYRSELEAFQASMPGEPVPGPWIETMESAITDANLPVIDEMLDELQRARLDNQAIKSPTVSRSGILSEFLSLDGDIYKELEDFSDGKAVWQHISANKDGAFGLNFEQQNARIKKVLEAIGSWKKRNPPRQDTSNEFGGFYDKVVSVLDFLGLEASETAYRKKDKTAIGYRIDDRFAALYVKVKPAQAERPFPMFSDTGSQPIIIAHNEWTPSQLQHFMSNIHMTGKKPILISGVPMSREQRAAFAHYYKHEKTTLFHVDMVMALFLASRQRNATESSDLRKFLWLTLPWTYFNPYVGGDTTYPPPRQMRFGRQSEINRLLEMTNGHAIVYGGRQLGKSTILQEVQKNFDNPSQKQHAHYALLDKNEGRLALDLERWKSARKKVWSHLYEGLCKNNLITSQKAIQDLEPEDMAKEVEDALLANAEHKVIFIFDEIDPILNLDNAHNFGIFRGIRELVSKPGIQGRFKVIIAGLENVRRFADSPNNPLQQLGGSLQVSIMSTQDALHLIEEPVGAAGYRFESPQVANRILSVTNRHPGLIQVFCHELLSYMAAGSREAVGKLVIRDGDVTAVGQNRDVIDLIRQRFDMTLVLDRRYMVIVYGILLERRGTRPFSAKEAHEIAKEWLPEEFDHLSTKQFETFLIELCGLGVLKDLPNGGGFALRSTNIQRLIGDEDDIIDSLQRAINQRREMSPLERHAIWIEDALACPITFRDEQGLLGASLEIDDDADIKEYRSWKYTTSLIVGSEALGLNHLTDTLPRLYEAEKQVHPELKGSQSYAVNQRNDADFDSANTFRTNVLALLTVQAEKAPQMLIVTVTGNQPISSLLAMIQAAHSLNDINMENRYPVRVIFALTPRAYWQWLTHPMQTQGQEELQPFINLSTWNVSGVAHLLEMFNMVNSPEAIERYIKHTEGWHMSIHEMGKIVSNLRSKKDWSELGDKFPPLVKTGGKQLKKFRAATGVDDLDWVVSFLTGCIDFWEGKVLDKEEFGQYLDDFEMFGDKKPSLDMVIAWLSGMNLIKRKSGEGKDEQRYQVSEGIYHAITADD